MGEKYQILDVAGSGMYGNVYKATDETGRTLAIKFFKAEMFNNREEILEQIIALARIDHPNVVKLHTVEDLEEPTEGGKRTCAVMEFLDGVPLIDYKESITLEQCKNWCNDLIGALREIIKSGLTHGDLHTGNVMVCQSKLVVIDLMYLLTLKASNDYDYRIKKEVLRSVDVLDYIISLCPDIDEKKFVCCRDSKDFDSLVLQFQEIFVALEKRLEEGYIRPNEDFLNEFSLIDYLELYPDYKNVKIQDIFVYPEVSLYERATSKSIDNVYKICKNEGATVIVGEPYSGKSWMLRKMYLDLHREEYTPLFLDMKEDFSRFKNLDERKIDIALLDSFVSQYDGHRDEFEYYMSLQNAERRILLIDDADALFESSISTKVIELLLKSFKTVILFTGQYVDASVWRDEGPPLKRYEIEKYGYRKMSSVVRLWIGCQNLSDSDAEEKSRRYEKHIADLISINMLPTQPFFIIFSLLQLENMNKVPFPRQGVSYGYVIQHYIYEQLTSSGMIDEVLSIYYNVLSIMAVALWSDVSQKGISYKIVKTEVDKYIDEMGLALKARDLIDDLCESKVIEYIVTQNEEKRLKFKYESTQLFFLAKHISTYPSGDDGDTFDGYVDRLLSNINMPGSANVLTFLLFHKEADSLLIDKIVESINSNFFGVEEPDLAHCFSWIQGAEKKLSISTDDIPKTYRDEMYTLMDGRQSESISDKERMVFNRINVEIKSLFNKSRLLCIILRSTLGSLNKNTKTRLLKVLFSAHLRFIGFINMMMSQLLNAEYPNVTPNLYESVVDLIQSSLMSNFLYVAKMIDTDGLNRVLDDLLGSSKGEVEKSYQLFNAAIRLESSSINWKNLERVFKVENSVYIKNAIRDLVWVYMRSNYISYEEANRLCVTYKISRNNIPRLLK